MTRFIRYFSQNRIRIIITILIVVFIIIIIQVVNYILKQSRTEYQPSNSITIEDTSIPSESVITGEKLPEETTNTNIETIQQFVDYCNNKQYENAYNLLSQDCKDELYNTLDTFINNYCNNIFTTNITYNLELWHQERLCDTMQKTTSILLGLMLIASFSLTGCQLATETKANMNRCCFKCSRAKFSQK